LTSGQFQRSGGHGLAPDESRDARASGSESVRRAKCPEVKV
jgi:hypothetical protein